MAKLDLCPFCGGESVLVPTSSCNGYIACVGECKMETGIFWDEPMTNHQGERVKWDEIATKALSPIGCHFHKHRKENEDAVFLL